MNRSLYSQIVREAIQQTQRHEAAIVRASYTHKVFYKGQKERCYLGSKVACEDFAEACGNCNVVPASKAEIEVEALRVERWRPNY